MGRRSVGRWASVVGLLGSLAARSTHAQPQPERWTELLAMPRVGGRLTALAVDPRDDSRLFVGTAEGTLLVSEDGGITFEERAVVTRPIVERSVGLATIVDAAAASPGQLGTRTREYTLRADPPFATRPSTRPGFQFDTLFFSIRPDYVGAETAPTTTTSTPQLLRTAVTSRERSAEPIVHVMVCPGAALPVLVLTQRAVVAMDETGATTLEVLATGSDRIVRGRCTARGATRVVVGTSQGTYVSTDGVTFVPFLAASGPRAVATVEQASDGTVYLASGRRVLVERTRSPELVPLYEEDELSAPLSNVTALALGPGGILAIGSDDGLRLHREGQLAVVAPEVFDGLRVRDVAWAGEWLYVVAAACPIGIRVARCQDTRLWVSHDRGGTWREEAELARRRSLLRLAAVPNSGRVWLLSTGGLWVSMPGGAPSGAPNDVALAESLALWAQRRLAATPALEDVLEHALARCALDESSIDRVAATPVTRHFVPLLEARVALTNVERARERSARPSGALGVESFERVVVTVGVQASWNWGFDLPNAPTVPEPSAAERVALQELRRQVAYAVEDAWRERVRWLERLRDGEHDPMRALVAQERVRALEAVIETYLGGSLSTVEPEAFESS